MTHKTDKYNELSSLEEQIELNKSILDNIQSKPLAEGYEIVNTPEYQDALTFFDDEIEVDEDRLDFLEDDKFLNDFFS